MPHYEYHCKENGAVVEVRHAMAEELRTWGEVCARTGTPVGDTPAGTPVERLMSLTVPTPGPTAREPAGCGPGCACAAAG